MRSHQLTQVIDKTDWLKSAAILFVAIDHYGYFFIENNEWWSVVGRLAAPIFFFLLGYAETKRIP
ncbi:MAG: TraX family protein, partial [Hyphomicrobiales bacterium]